MHLCAGGEGEACFAPTVCSYEHTTNGYALTGTLQAAAEGLEHGEEVLGGGVALDIVDGVEEATGLRMSQPAKETRENCSARTPGDGCPFWRRSPGGPGGFAREAGAYRF